MDTGGNFNPQLPSKKISDYWMGDSFAKEGATLLDIFAGLAMVSIVVDQGITPTIEVDAYALAKRMVSQKRIEEAT